MIETPMDVLHRFPVRKSKKQKQAFRESVQSYAQSLGYQTRVEKGSRGCQNVIIGDPETARFLVTAHYDTPTALLFPHLLAPCNPVLFWLCQLLTGLMQLIPAFALGGVALWWLSDPFLAYLVLSAAVLLSILLMLFGPANRRNANITSGVVTVLEIAASMPRNLRERVCFILFDKGERGMAGSSLHRRKHRYASDGQTVLNLDCVGDGDTIMLLPSKTIQQDPQRLELLTALEKTCGEKSVRVREKGFAARVSDHTNFPDSVGICALHKGKLGYWLGRTHTFRDTVLEYTNVNILRACLISYIGSGAAELRKEI